MTSLDSIITEVVVFSDRARVTRRGSLALETGVHSIEVPNLPLALQPDSVRAAGGGSAANTSSAAPAKRPSSKATRSASSSSMPPRAKHNSRAPGFICASRLALNRFCVSALSGRCSER